MQLKNKKERSLKICVSGAQSSARFGIEALESAKIVGNIIASHGHVLTTSAATGFSLWSAMGAKDAKGSTVGFSPASQEKEHVDIYNLPTDYFDLIVYTGFGYSGSDLLMMRSSDALVFGCGDITTLNDFSLALEEHKPIGVLQGPWQTDELIHGLIQELGVRQETIIFDTDPRRLIEQIIKKVHVSRVQNHLM